MFKLFENKKETKRSQNYNMAFEPPDLNPTEKLLDEITRKLFI